jgi:hypothetical protein
MRLRKSGYLLPAGLTGWLALKGLHPHLPGWPCPLRALTGIPCRGCFLSGGGPAVVLAAAALAVVRPRPAQLPGLSRGGEPLKAGAAIVGEAHRLPLRR